MQHSIRQRARHQLIFHVKSRTGEYGSVLFGVDIDSCRREETVVAFLLLFWERFITNPHTNRLL